MLGADEEDPAPKTSRWKEGGRTKSEIRNFIGLPEIVRDYIALIRDINEERWP